MTIFYLLCNENTISDQMHNFPPLRGKEEVLHGKA
jgi:hypothetical protein